MDYRYSGHPERYLEDDVAVLYRALTAHATVHGCGKDGPCEARRIFEAAYEQIKSLRDVPLEARGGSETWADPPRQQEQEPAPQRIELRPYNPHGVIQPLPTPEEIRRRQRGE
jgi:hypothetical protein